MGCRQDRPELIYTTYYNDFGEKLSDQYKRQILERNLILKNGEQQAFERLGVLQNAKLPVQRGQVFEETTFALIQAEINDWQLPYKAYKGDGQSFIKYKGKQMKAPEGTDAIVQNKNHQDQFQVLQFKVSNPSDNSQETPTGLKRLVESFYKTHPEGPAKPNTQNAKLDDEFYQLLHPRKAKFITAKGDGQKFEVNNGNQNEQVEVFDKVIIEDKEIQVPSSKECEDWIKKVQPIIPDQAKLLQYQDEIKFLEKKLMGHLKKIDATPANSKNRNKLQVEIEVINDQLAHLKKETQELEIKIEKNFVEFFHKLRSKDFIFSRMKEAAIIGGFVSGASAMILSFIDNLQKYQKGEIGILEFFQSVSYQTTTGALKGGALSALIVGFESYGITLLAENSVDLLGQFFKKAGVIVGIGFFCYQIFDIVNQCQKGQITKQQSLIYLARISAVGILNTSICVIATSFWGGPVGLLIGIVGNLIVGTLDYFFGQRICDMIFPQIQRIEGIPPLGCEPLQKPQFRLEHLNQPFFGFQLLKGPQFGLEHQKKPNLGFNNSSPWNF
eukprot:403349707